MTSRTEFEHKTRHNLAKFWLSASSKPSKFNKLVILCSSKNTLREVLSLEPGFGSRNGSAISMVPIVRPHTSKHVSSLNRASVLERPLNFVRVKGVVVRGVDQLGIHDGNSEFSSRVSTVDKIFKCFRPCT